MEQPDRPVKPSFFDDGTAHEDFSFWKMITPTTKKLSDIRLIEGILFKHSKRTNFWKSRYYVLFEDRLAYFKNGREKKETAYCTLQNMRLEKISSSVSEKDDKFGIYLLHNGKRIELYARSSEVQEKWYSKLKLYCVLTNYTAHYTKNKLIGEGTFAKVYLVTRKSDGYELAAKTFDKGTLGKVEKAKASLINEINIMRKLEHENIIKLHEVHEDEAHVYLVLELLHGGELFERIVKKGIYTEKDASILMQKLLSALDSMHTRNIMHRDLKPENLILKDMKNNHDVKIADFGLATAVTQGDYLFRRCGTPGYVAPEVLADERYDQKVDIFSAGVILYILLTGGSPFHGKSYNEILLKNKKCDIRFNLKDAGHGVSSAAIDLLKNMLNKNPKQRISAREALEHPWMIANGETDQLDQPQSAMLSSAQENMKRFQEQHRFNVKNIKPKDLNSQNTMERSGHCPSPVINGRTTTIVESKQRQATTSRKSGFAGATESQRSTFDESEDLDQTDENMTIGEQVPKYSNNFNLLSTVKDNNNNSTNSSINNTPVMISKQSGRPQQKQVMDIQGNLLNLIKPEESIANSGPTISSYYKDETPKGKSVESVRNNLKGLQ